MRRHRNVKIVATLGPSSSDLATIRALFEAGADVFRLNMSHGDHAEQKARYDAIRAVEAEMGRPIAVLADLVAAGRLDLSRSITDVVSLEDVGEGIRRLHEREGNPIRILVQP